MGLSNSEFAKMVGCSITSATRYRNGHRRPQVELLESIRVALGLSWEEVFAEWSKGRESFGAFLREHVFDDDADPVGV